MENEMKATSIFDALGVQDENKVDLGSTPEFTPEASGSEGAGGSVAQPADEATFRASDLKAIFGDFESIDSIKEKYMSIEERAKKFEEFEPYISERETLVRELESPFANEKLANLNAFIKTTGINDLDVANKFVGKSASDMRQSPIQTMALAEVIKDPSLLEDLTFDEICETIAEENNTYVDASSEDIPKTMKMKLGKNISIVEEKLKNIGENKDFIASLREQINTQKEGANKLVSDWKPIVTEASKINELDIEIDGLKVKTSVSEETRTQINQEVMGIISSNPLPANEQNMDAINMYIRTRAEALEAKNVYKALITAVRGEAQEAALREFHNGSEVVKHEKPDAKSEKSQLQRYFESQQ
jgi:hypothetical protein